MKKNRCPVHKTIMRKDVKTREVYCPVCRGNAYNEAMEKKREEEKKNPTEEPKKNNKIPSKVAPHPMMGAMAAQKMDDDLRKKGIIPEG